MIIKMAVGLKTMAASGSLVLGPGETSFSVTLENLTITFLFEPGTGAPAMTADPPIGGSRVIHLLGWSNPLGTAQAFPNVATIAGQPVGINIYSSTIGDGATQLRLINYSVFSG